MSLRGLTEPTRVERCRDSYSLELDNQLMEGTRWVLRPLGALKQESGRRLEEATRAKKMRLRQEALRLRDEYHEQVGAGLKCEGFL